MIRKSRRLILWIIVLLFTVLGCYRLEDLAPASKYMPQVNPYSLSGARIIRPVTVYFPIKGECYLGTYLCDVDIYTDSGDSIQKTLIRILAEGVDPSLNLSPVFPGNANRVSMSIDNELITITLHKDILGISGEDPDEISQETAKKRKLILYAVVNTMIDSTDCQKVQILIDMNENGSGVKPTRKQVGLIGDREDELLDALVFNDELICTPSITVQLAFSAAIEGNAERLYLVLADTLNKPSIQLLQQTIIQSEAEIKECYVSGVVISADGKSAIASVDIIRILNGNEQQLLNQSVQLVRDQGIWRVNYASIDTLLFR